MDSILQTRDWSYSDWARAAGIDKSTISRIHAGETSPRASILLRLALAAQAELPARQTHRQRAIVPCFRLAALLKSYPKPIGEIVTYADMANTVAVCLDEPIPELHIDTANGHLILESTDRAEDGRTYFVVHRNEHGCWHRASGDWFIPLTPGAAPIRAIDALRFWQLLRHERPF